jgi:hypothetical protein
MRGERAWGVAEELRRAPSRLTDDGCLAARFEHVVALSIGLGVDRLVHRRWGTHLLTAPSRTRRVAVFGNDDLRTSVTWPLADGGFAILDR